MRKIIAGLAIGAAAAALGGTGALAAGNGAGAAALCRQEAQAVCDWCKERGAGFVDVDGDGICDHYGIGTAGTAGSTGSAGTAGRQARDGSCGGQPIRQGSAGQAGAHHGGGHHGRCLR